MLGPVPVRVWLVDSQCSCVAAEGVQPCQQQLLASVVGWTSRGVTHCSVLCVFLLQLY
jgi:hypothetical protein